MRVRLAPIQIQYGIGHPLSSGIADSIDYSVISANMAPPLRKLTQKKPMNSKGSLALFKSAKGIINSTVDKLQSQNGFHYTEQLVLFDSLGYYIPHPIEMYKDSNDDVNKIKLFMSYRGNSTQHDNKNEVSCSVLNDKLRSWEVYPFISAEGLGCRANIKRQYHVYSCMQLVKKLHPDFDEVLINLLRLDPTAKVLLLEGSRVIVERLRDNSKYESMRKSVCSYYKTEEQTRCDELIANRFVFVSRLPHIDYLGLLSLSSVFLNPIYFGSGITSSEALAVCVPVLTLPSYSSVLSFAEAQVRILGNELAKLLIVEDNNSDAQVDGSLDKRKEELLQMYSQRAVDIVYGTTGRSLTDTKDEICNRALSSLFSKSLLYNVTTEWISFLISFHRK